MRQCHGSRQNSLEFIIEPEHFIKADNHVGFYELFILCFYPEADCCQIPPGSILPVPATIYFPKIQSPTTSEIYRIIKSKARYHGDRELYQEQRTAHLIRINSAKPGNLKSLTVKESVLLLQNFIVHVRVFIRYSYLQNKYSTAHYYSVLFFLCKVIVDMATLKDVNFFKKWFLSK
jgi:hypothetical protein